MSTNTDCIFCKIADGQIPASVVASDEQAVAFLDLSPKSPGHTLVIPRRHVADLADDALALAEITALTSTVAQLLQQRLGADGLNLVINSGAVAGQEVPHLHQHLVPRYADGTPQPASEVDQILNRLVG